MFFQNYHFFSDIIRKLKLIKMCNLSNFQRDQTIGARFTGARETKIDEMLSVSTCTVAKVLTAFKKERKASSSKSNIAQLFRVE